MKKQILAKFSPWLLAAACALLTLIIGVFAISNYQREKQLMTEAMLQQGITITRFVTSSTRASLRGNLRSIRVAMWQWTDHVQQAINNSADQPGLLFLGLVDASGDILASTDSTMVGTKIAPSTLEFIKKIDNKTEETGQYRFSTEETGKVPVFQVATSYHPFGQRNFIFRMHGRGFMSPENPRNMRGMRGLRGLEDSKLLEQLENLSSQSFTLLVELDLAQYNKAIRGKLLQIVSLSLVLLLVGIGGWISLMTLQGLKGSQIRLRQIREYTDLLVSSLPIGLIATGDDRAIRIFNTSAEKILGVAAVNAIGKFPENVLPVELSTEFRTENADSGGVIQKEIVLGDGSRRNRSLMTISLPVVDSEKRFAGNTLLIQDVSDVKELQVELRRNERLAALGKMAAGVAHELRNPLSSIKGLTLLLKGKITNDDDGHTTADILVQEVERLNRSIGELLDYARPEKLELEKVDILDVIEKAVSLIAVDVEAAEVSLQMDCAEGYHVKGDRDKLNQVFLNLLINSLQAVESKGTITIQAFRQEDHVVCSIEDDGCGLDEENIAKVFDPYFTTKKDGTGLGLAMSAKIVEEHSGSIEIRSRLGAGTTVSVRLPVYLDES